MAKHGFGAKFFIGNPSTLTECAEVLEVGLPSMEVEVIETTSHGSAGGVREFIPGLADPGEISIVMLYVPGSATATMLEAAVAARAVRPFKCNVPAATGTRDFTGNCIPMKFEKDPVPIDDKMQCTFTAKVSGIVTEAAGA